MASIDVSFTLNRVRSTTLLRYLNPVPQLDFHRHRSMNYKLGSVLAILTACAMSAFAESPEPPSWLDSITRVVPGGYANLRPVKLGYSLSWNNRVNAGKFLISVIDPKDSSGQLIGDASGRSSGFARILWPYDFRARSIIYKESLRPVVFQLREKDRKATNSYDIIFERDRQVYTTTAQKKNKEAITATSGFDFDFGQDILSSSFYLRSHSLEDGEKLSMVVTPFNCPYLTELEVMGRESRRIKGKVYETIRLDVRVGKINTDLSIKTYDKIKQTSLWVSDDEYRIPLELQSQISVGFVSARLTNQEWLD